MQELKEAKEELAKQPSQDSKELLDKITELEKKLEAALNLKKKGIPLWSLIVMVVLGIAFLVALFYIIRQKRRS